MSAARAGLACAFLLGVATCGGKGPVGGAAGTTGGAGASATAGTTGLPTGGAGTSALAGTSGTAGVAGTMDGCQPIGSETLASGMCAPEAFKHEGVCRCRQELPNICAAGCVDLQNDADNCGCCGHACAPMAACNQGQCGPEPFAVVPGIPLCRSMDIAISGGTLYWTDKTAGTVSSRPTSGGVITTLASGLPTPSQIAVNGDAVYWLVPNKIMRAIKGGSPQILVMAPAEIPGFVVSPDGASLYYSTEKTVMRVAATGGAPTVVAREERGALPMALALDGDLLVYPGNIEGIVHVVTLVEGMVVSCGGEGAEGLPRRADCLRVAQGQGSLFFEKIVAQQGFALFADGYALKKTAMKLVGSLDSAQGGASVGLSERGPISGFASTATTVYFATGDASNPGDTIYKASFDAPPRQTRIARGQYLPRSVAIDDQRVYWSTGNCAIMATDL